MRSFAPKANRAAELAGDDREIDILVSTDVLSEGQNLQDCGHLINYDLHWNPTRMVQRAGRIDRIGTDFNRLWIYNMFPDEGLERLLGLVESLSRKIADIDATGFLDASVLGEAVHFNTLRRIRDEDGSVIEEEEQFTELASNEFLFKQLRDLLDSGGREALEELPDGIHSGLMRPGARGVFFYFQGRPAESERLHFWKYYDLKSGGVVDNRYVMANLIACDWVRSSFVPVSQSGRRRPQSGRLQRVPMLVSSGMFISALNDVFDVGAKRDAARDNHVPNPVLLFLYFVTILTVGLLGYGCGLGNHRNLPATATVCFLIALVILVIIDLDRPHRGLIKISQKPMLELRASLH